MFNSVYLQDVSPVTLPVVVLVTGLTPSPCPCFEEYFLLPPGMFSLKSLNIVLKQ